MKRELWIGVVVAILVIAIAAGGPAAVRALRSLPAASELAARRDQRIVTLEVGGMTCAGCVARIQTTLAGVAGVSSARVRLGERRAYVVCGHDVADSSLISAVGRAGPGYLAAVAHD